MSNSDFAGVMSTNEIWRDNDTSRCLTDDLDAMDAIHTALPNTYAAINHTHSGYAASNHTHSNYAASNHTHDGYAPIIHTHDNYAQANHTHDNYFSVDGGTINGNTNVNGILRVNGQQSFYYQTSTQSQTVGTNNATGGTTICCGPNADIAMNGLNTKTPNIIPRGNNVYYCGSSDLRWKGIYSAAAVNVSSDERLKENIKPIDVGKAVDFINNIDVKSFNYIGDDKPCIGVIAQDINEVSPELSQYLVEQDEEGYYGVKTSDIVFPLIVAVQELTKQVEKLQK